VARGALSRAAVLFDIGDTLVRRPDVGPGRRIADALGLGRDEARTITGWLFREAFASPRALAERVCDAFGLPPRIEESIAEIWRAQETEPVEVDGATACVAAVREHGARVGVVSNIWRPYEAGFRRACPAIVPLVETWQLSYRAGVAKPDPTLFRAALAALEVEAASTMMIGDSLEKDVRPALALGMHAIWVAPHVDGSSLHESRDADAAVRRTAADVGSDTAARVWRVDDLDAARTAAVRFLADRRLV
jgi:FMN phosphatase YigB (HAD superfamily)